MLPSVVTTNVAKHKMLGYIVLTTFLKAERTLHLSKCRIGQFMLVNMTFYLLRILGEN